MRWQNLIKISYAALDVSGALMTSTNFIAGTGLKKCRPPKFFFNFVNLLETSSNKNEDVLVTNMQWLNY